METMEARIGQALCFAAVAEDGSFTRAAERLGVSKGHVSKQISALEKALGTQLLFRTTRRLTLTESGRIYLGYCKALRDTALEAERAVSAMRREVAGKLRITAAPSFGDTFLLDMLLAFRALHPAVEVDLDLSTGRRDLVADGYDFGIRTTRTLEGDLVARGLGIARDLAVVSPRLLDAFPPVRTPEDLAVLPCILNTHFRDDGEWILVRDGTPHTVRMTRRMSANHYPLIRSAAVAGAGVARLPKFLVQPAIDRGELVELLPDYELGGTPVYLVWPQRRHMPWRNRVFLEFVQTWFAEPSRAALLS